MSRPVFRAHRAAAVASLAWALACAKLDQPSDPVWGKEPCADCSMLVSERRFSAQLVHDGERRYFDDVGCMVLWAEKHGGLPAHAWVHDGTSGPWAPARAARFAEGARTPMDYGLEVRADGALGWEEARDRVLAKRPKQGVKP